MDKEYHRQYSKKWYKKRRNEITELRRNADARRKNEIVKWRRSIAPLVDITSTIDFRDWFNSNSTFPWDDGILDEESSTMSLLDSSAFKRLFSEFLTIAEFHNYLNLKKEERLHEQSMEDISRSSMEIARTAWMRRYRRIKMATPGWFEKECLEGIEFLRLVYNKLFPDDAPWHIDHIIPIAGADVCGLHVHTNMQLLPWRENLKKSNKFDF